eukprot:21216-Chlamydomonas_euryale.AAC.9
MMLMLARRVREAERVFQERRVGEPVGMELRGKTLGIIGLGNSGRALAAAAGGVGMEVRYEGLVAAAVGVSYHQKGGRGIVLSSGDRRGLCCRQGRAEICPVIRGR